MSMIKKIMDSQKTTKILMILLFIVILMIQSTADQKVSYFHGRKDGIEQAIEYYKVILEFHNISDEVSVYNDYKPICVEQNGSYVDLTLLNPCPDGKMFQGWMKK